MGHKELKMIIKTIQAKLTDDTNLLIQGVKGKVDKDGNIIHSETKASLINFVDSFISLIDNE